MPFLRISSFSLRRLHSLSSSTLREFCYAGIPASVRARVWPQLTGNILHITPELYQIFKSRSSRIINQEVINRQQQKQEQHGEQLHPGEVSREDSIATIQHDIPRTHANESRFHDGGPMNLALESILQTYACYRPDIGYVQGMSYIAAMCVNYLDEYQAFATFANLLNRHVNFSLFLLAPEIVKAFSLTFDHLFQRALPQLYRHLLSESVSSEIFLLDWALTLFSKALPIPLAARLWDVYLLEGELFFIKASLGMSPFSPSHLTQLADPQESWRCTSSNWPRIRPPAS
jgi:TBC1 domain family member 14